MAWMIKSCLELFVRTLTSAPRRQLPLIQRKQNKKHQKDCLVNCTLHPGFIDNVYWPCLTDIGAIVEHDNFIKKETETDYYKN